MYTYFRAIALSVVLITLLGGGVRAASCVSYNEYATGNNPSKNGYVIAWTGYDKDGDFTVLWERESSRQWILMYFLDKTDQICVVQHGTDSKTRILGLDI